jgi:hypothetical protein
MSTFVEAIVARIGVVRKRVVKEGRQMKRRWAISLRTTSLLFILALCMLCMLPSLNTDVPSACHTPFCVYLATLPLTTSTSHESSTLHNAASAGHLLCFTTYVASQTEDEGTDVAQQAKVIWCILHVLPGVTRYACFG